ncbi:hypothetical protein GTP58_29840 [Duganella sp. CY15W]|uniref:hypothetical protein n=1 Tax=Duganella sp. CY15W TaxID=2692172 RepID=UPI0013692591|nr:hypothetical protein [Duganella sp. CY15W]MYM32542.1 hypothetical protein [Duganella sp. CY15W]
MELSEKFIATLANSIIELQFTNWRFYVAIIFTSFVTSLFFSWAKSYGSERGKFRAITENFSEIKRQLSETTSTAKNIELSLSHSEWAVKEYKTVRRNKLEDLSLATYRTQEWISERLHFSGDEEFKSSGSPVFQVLMLSELYFPELKPFSLSFFNLHQEFLKTALECVSELRVANSEMKKIQISVDFAKETKDVAKMGELVSQYGEAVDKYTEVRNATHTPLMNSYQSFTTNLHQLQDEISKIMEKTIRDQKIN